MKTKLMQLADAYAMRMAGSTLRNTNQKEARAALEAEIDQVIKDAERYRWLRDQNADLEAGFYVGDETDALPEDVTWVGSDLDAAIDAAMKESK